MDKKYCVYQHISPNGLRYIGKTSRYPALRWFPGYKYKQNKDFYEEICRVGEETFRESFQHLVFTTDGRWVPWDSSMTIEETNIFSKIHAELLEKHWILAYDTTNIKNGLNRTTGGDKDFVLHPVAIERNRQAHIGLYEGENNPAFGMKHSKKTKEYLSSLARQRTGNKNHMFGKHHSEEAKEKMRIAHLGRYDGEDNPFFGKYHSPETKEILSKQRSKPIHMYSLNGEYLRSFPSVSIAAQEMGCAVTSISMCATGKTKTSQGRLWRYEKHDKLPESLADKDIQQK